MTVRVGVNGFGTIGRRVADAVTLQSDMKLIGIVKIKPDYKAQLALRRGYNVYAVRDKELKAFKEAGLNAQGILEDLVEKVDIMVDATPRGKGEEAKTLYEKHGIPAVFQGGEETSVADVSFVAQCNYEKAYGARYIRCVSCNTTALCRTLDAVSKAFGIKHARATIVRRSADPEDTVRGPIDAIVPDPVQLPSHHGPDVNTVIPYVPLTTMALKVPTTYMHVHAISATLKRIPTVEEAVEVFEKTSRVLLVEGKKGITSTAALFDYARDLRRPREDLYEICVWRESIALVGDEIFYLQAVDQEADVVPENIDAIRAALKIANAETSMRSTNDTLGITK